MIARRSGWNGAVDFIPVLTEAIPEAVNVGVDIALAGGSSLLIEANPIPSPGLLQRYDPFPDRCPEIHEFCGPRELASRDNRYRGAVRRGSSLCGY